MIKSDNIFVLSKANLLKKMKKEFINVGFENLKVDTLVNDIFETFDDDEIQRNIYFRCNALLFFKDYCKKSKFKFITKDVLQLMYLCILCAETNCVIYTLDNNVICKIFEKNKECFVVNENTNDILWSLIQSKRNDSNMLIQKLTGSNNLVDYLCLINFICDMHHYTKEFYYHSNWVLKSYTEYDIEDTINIISKHIDNIVVPVFIRLNEIVEINFDYCKSIINNKNHWNFLKHGSRLKRNQEKILEVEFPHSTSLSIIDRLSSDCETNICSTHSNVCICMIDIVNFSQWCNKQEPQHIFTTMTKYNTFLNDNIYMYDDVEKIEMVGDSVMIVGGLYSKNNTIEYTHNIINMCHSILHDINTLNKIFNDESISIRIGIHNGDVYSGYILNPKKFQLFGNSINVASRLESTSFQGILNISSKTYAIIKNTEIVNKFEIGRTNTMFLKGVGVFDSLRCFMRKDSVLIADDVLITCNIIRKILKHKKCDIVTDKNHCFSLLKQNSYDMVFMDRFFDKVDIFEDLKAFRIWETKYRLNPQKIVLITSLEPFKPSNINLYVDDTIIKNDKFIETISNYLA